MLAGCAYAWMIDDVSITDVLADDGKLLRPFCGEYSSLPILQAAGFQIRGRIINNGFNAISGAKILFNVTDNLGSPIYSDSSAVSGMVNPGDTSSYLYAIGSFIPTSIGQYNVFQTLINPGDLDNSNDTATAIVLVDD